MTPEELHKTVEQNRENLKTLLNALGADHELAEDPEKKAQLGAYFGNSPEHVKEAEMDEYERTEWMLEENAKAIAAAAEEAGARRAQTPTIAESEGMGELKAFLGGER